MIVGVGVDAVEISRIARAVSRTPRLLERVFSDAERGRPAHSLAVRWAAKEAARKALGAVLAWRDVEVISAKTGRPMLRVAGYENLRFHVSLSHTAQLAVAVVVAEQA